VSSISTLQTSFGVTELVNPGYSYELGAWDWSVNLRDPILRQLFARWTDRRSEDRLPVRDDFDPLSIKECLGAVFLAVAEEETDDFRYTLIGTKIVQHVGVDNTGRLVSEVFGTPGLTLYRAVRDGARPVRVSGVVDWRHQEHKAYEAVLMPLADDGRTVNRMIGGMVFFSATVE